MRTTSLAHPAPLMRVRRKAHLGFRVRRKAHLGNEEFATVVEQCSMVLGTGVSPHTAFTSVARAHGESPSGRLAHRLAHTPAALLDYDPASELMHVEQGRSLIVCIRVCDTTGAALAGLLSSLASTLRDLADAERARRNAFAGAKTTAHILMALPLLALGLGYLIGAHPLRVLFNSWTGMLMLLVGISLSVAGWAWMRALLHAAQPPRATVDPVILLDILAHTVASGLPLGSALSRIGEALRDTDPGPSLSLAGAALSRGTDPGRALGMLEGELAHLHTTALLAHSTGAQLAPLLRSASTNIRRSRLRDVEKNAATLNVRLVLPTGLTILPAFVVLGIIPVVTDVLDSYFGFL